MAKDRLLVTGATGFVGSWTLHHWSENNPEMEIWATSEKPHPPNIEADKYHQVDLRNPLAVHELVFACRPTHVIHLAGLIGKASLADHISINVLSTENLYQALLETEKISNLKVVQASSAAIYGLVSPEDLPITENQQPKPITPYALSKLAQQYLASAMWHTHRLQVMSACIFNILGPAQPDDLVPMTFIKQFMDVRAGLKNRLQVGQTASRRDFIDVRDVVKAFDLLLKHGQGGETYNVASGQDISIQKIINQLLQITGLQIPIEVASNRFQPMDVPCVRADISKIMAATDWKPSISMHESLKAMWPYSVS